MAEIKTLVPVPAWVDAMQAQSNLIDVRASYAAVPLIYRALNLRCDSLLRVPVHLYRGEEEIEWESIYPDVSLDELLWLTQAALLMCGASYVVKLKNQYGVKRGLQWLNPFTVDVKYNNGQIYFEQRSAIGQGKTWTADEMIYTRLFNPSDDIGAGVSPCEVAMQAAKLSLNIASFAGNFFEHGAMPITTVSVVGAMQKQEQERIQNFFRRATQGVRNAFRVLAVGNDVKIQTTQNPLSELATPELNDAARKDIARAFGLPVTMLDADENYATASQHATTYLMDTVLPAADKIAAALNKQLLEAMGLELEFAYDEMQEFQADEAERASSLQTLISAIQSAQSPEILRAAMEILGYDIPEEIEAVIFAPHENEEAQQEQQQAADMQAQNDSGDMMQDPNAEAKAIERAQFRRYVKKGKDPAKFVFKVLDESEKKMLLTPQTVKSISATSERFKRELEQLVTQAWNEGGKISKDMRGLVLQYVEDAYFEGVLEAGGSPDQLSSEDYGIVAQLENEQLQYVDKFAQDVKDATDDAAQQESIRRRITLWAENIYRAGQRGWAETLRTRKQRIIWNTANDELVCPICGPLNGKIVEAGKPFSPGIYNEPAHPNCRCVTMPYLD